MESSSNHPGAFVFEIVLRNGVRKRVTGDDLMRVNGSINVWVRSGDQGASRLVYTASVTDVLDVTRLDAEVSVFTPAPAQDEETPS